MSYAVGFDNQWDRWIGYGVPAYCDHPGCGRTIDRGLSFVCGGEPYGGERGCGLYFCSSHLQHRNFGRGKNAVSYPICQRCRHGRQPFRPTPEHPDWIKHVLTDASWAEWREKEPEALARMQGAASPARGAP